MASGDAAGCDNTGESGTKGLLAFLSLGVSSFGPSSRRKGSGKKRASGDFIAQDTAARGSVTFSTCFALGLSAGDRGRTLSLADWIGMGGLHGSSVALQEVPSAPSSSSSSSETFSPGCSVSP